MSAEYDGKQRRGADGITTTLKVLPVPAQGKDRIRALMVTGDPDGIRDASFDDGMVLQGVDPFTMRQLQNLDAALVQRWEAIDAEWYN